MKPFRQNKKYFLHFFSSVFFILFFLTLGTGVFASVTDGTIDPADEGHYLAKLLDQTGLGNHQRINFGKFTAQSPYNIHVKQTGLTGYAWGELTGWIVTNCENTASGCSSANGNFKVVPDTQGVFSGYAWGENTGWINFGPFTEPGISQVKLLTGGKFGGTLGDAGYAWSQNFGWIIFDCTDPQSCVETDFRIGGGNPGGSVPPLPPSYECSDGIDNDGDSYVDYPSDPGCISSVDPVEFTPGVLPPPGGGSGNPTSPPVLPPMLPECSDGIDNDYDGVTDYPLDFGCMDQMDMTEYVFFAPPPMPPPLPPTEDPIAPSEGGGGGFTLPGIMRIIEEMTGRIIRVAAPLIRIGEESSPFFGIVAVSSLVMFFISNYDRLWQLLLWFFGFSGRRKKWGTVYDSITKYPLDPAYVVASDMAGGVVAEAITDLDGRYGFILPPGQYRLTAQKTNYEFPSKRLLGHPVDEVYSDLYFGETITIEEREQVITKNIPLDPLTIDWNEAEKRRRRLGSYSKGIPFKKILGSFFYIGFTAAILSFAFTFFLWWYFILLCIYVTLYVVKAYPASTGSMVRDTQTGFPAAYAIVKIYSAIDGREVMRKVTSAEGKFFALIPNAPYYMTVETKRDDGTYLLAHTTGVFTVRTGVVDQKIFI